MSKRTEVKAPQQWSRDGFTHVVFLAGSIEMGAAPLWRQRVIQAVPPAAPVLFLNPRRDDWDSSWKQSPKDHRFREQVTWEINGLGLADIKFFYFAPGTKSPITLLELGYTLGLGPDNGIPIVVCPEGFWKRGNVQVICTWEGVSVYDSLERGVQVLCSILE